MWGGGCETTEDRGRMAGEKKIRKLGVQENGGFREDRKALILSDVAAGESECV